MKNFYFKTAITSLLFICFSSFKGMAQPDSVSYYLNGIEHWAYQQPDVLSFRFTDRSQFTGSFSSNIVEGMDYYADGIQYIYFTPTATLAQKTQVYNAIGAHPRFEKYFVAATKAQYVNQPHGRNYWMGTDNLICIVFENEEISPAAVQNFANTYETEVLFSPDPSIKGGVHILRIGKECTVVDYYSPSASCEMVKKMWENDSSMISKVNPSVHIFRPHIPNDPLYADMWWVNNDGNFACNGTTMPESPANIGLECAWNFNQEHHSGPSYSGNGVVVAPIDFHGLEWTHPDMDANFIPGWYVTEAISGNVIVSQLNYDFGPIGMNPGDRAHLQCVSGVIGAEIDNGIGGIGVAHGASVKPVLHKGATAELNSALMTLLAETGSNEVDIVNMSFGFPGMSIQEAQGFSFYTALKKCHDEGRPYPGVPAQDSAKGMILIASTGNSNLNQAEIPAKLGFVFSVGATNPLDQRKSTGDGYDPVSLADPWGSNYFEYLDVTAPGVCVTGTDFTDFNTDLDSIQGYVPGDYFEFGGTSAAAPIVAGISALLLEKDGTLTNEQVYDAIRYSCDKVGGYTYSNNGANGKCLELGYGRVNACNALNILTELSINEENTNELYLRYNNPITDNLEVYLEENSNSFIEIFSATGKLVYSSNVYNSYISIDTKSWAQGIYLINVRDDDNHTKQAKIVKQ